MPKNSWKRRLEAARSLSTEEKIAWLDKQEISPKLARVLYLETASGPHDWMASHHDLPREIWLVRLLLSNFQFFSCRRGFKNPRWLKPLLWRELFLHKADILGEEIAELGWVFASDEPDAARRLMDLYEDDEAHPFTRGNVLYALMSAQIPGNQVERLQRTVRHALHNQKNPYARCTGCMLAKTDPTILPEDLEHLLADESGLKEGWGPLVKQYAQESIRSIRSAKGCPDHPSEGASPG